MEGVARDAVGGVCATRSGRANIRRHVRAGPLQVLDVGGGNGLDAIPFASQGHAVTLVDFADEMLAEAERNAEIAGVLDRVKTMRAEASSLPKLFPEPAFDVVLAHNLLQYVDDVDATVESLCRPLRPGGLISIISVNRYSEAYRTAIRDLDLVEALSRLDAPTTKAGFVPGDALHPRL
ncbi:MAG: hypothetical protein DLM70_14925, partial [Chloroflexi bacterium]